MTYLLDTEMVAELRKPDPDPHVLAWYSTVTSAEIFISALSMGEIRLGIERLRRQHTVPAAAGDESGARRPSSPGVNRGPKEILR